MTSSCLLLTLAPSLALGQDVIHNPDPIGTNPALPNLVRGQEAIQRLGSNLNALAQRAGLSNAELQSMILADEGLFVDDSGAVIFVDPDYIDGDAVDSNGPIKRSGPTIDLGEAFLLHSRPGSNFTIYLDFTGHRSVNNGWGHDITFPAYNTDSSTTSFSDRELREIIDHWRYIAEDFAIFDVDVTTEEPPIGRLKKSSNSDNTWGVRDLHTQATDGFGNGIGGVAGLFTFNSSQDRPVFSFNKGSNNGSMTGSHEVGHSLGLLHDGLNSATYHPGSSLGNFTWGPIMGAPFGAEVVQWSVGDYSGSTTTQNDVNIIGSNSNGTKVIADDHGNSTANATQLVGVCPTPNQVQICATITTRGDKDAFTFTSIGGLLSVSVGPDDSDGIVGNVDCFLELFDPAGVRLVGSNPTRKQSAMLSRVIGPGVYTLLVDGAIQGGLYSDYGSLGHYVMDVTMPGPTSDFVDLGNSLAGSGGAPLLSPSGFACPGSPIGLALSAANPSSLAFLAYGVSRLDASVLGGILVPNVGAGGGVLLAPSDASGNTLVSQPFPAGIGSGATLYFQYWVKDAGGPRGWAASNAVVLTVP